MKALTANCIAKLVSKKAFPILRLPSCSETPPSSNQTNPKMDVRAAKALSFRLKRLISKAGSTTRNVFPAKTAKGPSIFLC
jgi:hypothetical protein